jgi:hypothetical protein
VNFGDGCLAEGGIEANASKPVFFDFARKSKKRSSQICVVSVHRMVENGALAQEYLRVVA